MDGTEAQAPVLGWGGHWGGHYMIHAHMMGTYLRRRTTAWAHLGTPPAGAAQKLCSKGRRCLTMSENPPPRGYEHEQAIRDTSGLRVRTAEERTASGAGIEHTKFVIAAPIGVSNAQRARRSSWSWSLVLGLTYCAYSYDRWASGQLPNRGEAAKICTSATSSTLVESMRRSRGSHPT